MGVLSPVGERQLTSTELLARDAARTDGKVFEGDGDGARGGSAVLLVAEAVLVNVHRIIEVVHVVGGDLGVAPVAVTESSSGWSLVSGGGRVIGPDGEATLLAADVVALVRFLAFPFVFDASLGVESVHCEGVGVEGGCA